MSTQAIYICTEVGERNPKVRMSSETMGYNKGEEIGAWEEMVGNKETMGMRLHVVHSNGVVA